jgi:Ulp1 family protease
VARQLLFRYPSKAESDRVSITNLDEDRLAPGEFLNDNVIDFFFK